EVVDRLSAVLALLHVLDGLLVGGPGNTDGLRGDADAAGVQHAHGDLEALALDADDLFRTCHVVGELDLAGGRGADAQLRLGLAAVEALAAGVDHDGGDASRALLRVDDREQVDVAGD